MAPAIALVVRWIISISEIFIKNLGMELASITNNNNTPTLSLIIIIMPMEVACLKDIPSWEIGGMGGWLGFYDEDVDHIVWRESCRPSS